MTIFFKELRCASCICLVVLVGSLLPLRAQPEAFRFERLSLDDGVSQSTVLCIYQDRKGLMWFGTRHGANKYDGYRFTVYAHDATDTNSITDNWVTAISEDRLGTIWVGTRDGLKRLLFVDDRGYALALFDSKSSFINSDCGIQFCSHGYIDVSKNTAPLSWRKKIISMKRHCRAGQLHAQNRLKSLKNL